MARRLPTTITGIEPGDARFDRLVWAIAANYGRPVPAVQDWLMSKSRWERTALWYHVNPLWWEGYYRTTLDHASEQSLADVIDAM